MHLYLFLLLLVCLCLRGCTLSHLTKPLRGPMTQTSILPFAPNMWSSSEVSHTVEKRGTTICGTSDHNYHHTHQTRTLPITLTPYPSHQHPTPHALPFTTFSCCCITPCCLPLDSHSVVCGCGQQQSRPGQLAKLFRE